MFAGVIVTAIVVAFLADLLLSQRFLQTAGLRRARHMRDHIVIVGLGSVGIRVVTDLPLPDTTSWSSSTTRPIGTCRRWPNSTCR